MPLNLLQLFSFHKMTFWPWSPDTRQTDDKAFWPRCLDIRHSDYKQEAIPEEKDVSFMQNFRSAISYWVIILLGVLAIAGPGPTKFRIWRAGNGMPNPPL